MNINLLLRRFRLILAFFIIASGFLMAQSPAVFCPGTPVAVSDHSTNDEYLWNAVYWWAPDISSHNLGESGTMLDLLATDQCSASGNLSFRYILSLDLDYNNTYETFIDSDSLPPFNTVYYGNNASHLFSGTARQFDTRQVNPNQKWGFGLSVITADSSRKANVIWKNELNQTTVPQMPYGTHKIKWIVTDSCGASTVCEYGFTVKDKKKPTVVCLNGLSVNLMNMQGGIVDLWASDFLQYTEDNYTLSNQLKIATRRAGAGTGYPVNPDGTPQTGITFTCADLGIQNVELWSKDKDGNVDFCQTTVLIQDNQNACGPWQLVAGTITTETGEGIANVGIETFGSNNGTPIFNQQFTDISGNFFVQVPIPLSVNGTITPYLEWDPTNGVNSWDLLLISRHVLGLDTLDSPYKIISADANKSGTVTTFDIVEIRRLILGIYNQYPSNSSWRFVKKSQVFANPINPFAEVIWENLPIDSFPYNFIGCKIGDVDLTAIPQFQSGPEDRNDDPAYLISADRPVKQGERFIVHFKTPKEMQALQMTVSAHSLEVDKIIPGPMVTADHFGVFARAGKDRSVSAFTAAFENGPAEFDVLFSASRDGSLRDMLQITNEITPSMAFESNGRRHSVALQFEKANESADQPVLFQNTPNPWNESTAIPFYLPEAGEVQLSVTDQNGVVVYAVSQFFQSGNHQITFNRKQLRAGGIYYFRLETGGYTQVKKMVVSNDE